VKPTSRLLLALLALVALAAAAPARAQEQQPVTLTVEAGFDGGGVYRVGHWFPVTIVAANDGGDLRGLVEWRFPGEGEPSFRYEVDLPRGARKQITLPVVTSETQRSATVSLSSEGAEVLSQQLRLDPIVTADFAVGVVSSDQSLLNSLRALEVFPGLATEVVHIGAQRLPADAALLAGVDALFLHDVATADLAAAQLEALALWTRLGGQLVISGGANAERTASGLEELLPADVGELRADVSGAALAQLAGRPDLADGLSDLTASSVALRPGAVALDNAQLLTARGEGAGRVIFSAFDLAAARTWAGEAELWGAVLELEPRALVGFSFRQRSENLLRDSLQLAALRLPPAGVLLLLMLTYIVLIGPVNFIVLRRMGRIELAWVTTPLLVVVFLAAAYGASFVLRGTRPQISQLTVVQGFEGHERGQATGFLGVFSPQRRSYALRFGPESLITPGSFESFSFQELPVTNDDAGAEVRDLLIDVSALRTLMLEQPVTIEASVTSGLTVSSGQVQGELRLESGPPLRDAHVVFGASSQQLGELRPGDVATVDLTAGLENFPDLVSMDEDGDFNHERVMYSLFGYDRFNTGGPNFNGDKGLPDADGVYLLGWADGALIESQIDGASALQQGETLYIIRLDTEETGGGEQGAGERMQGADVARLLALGL
jgi:hypothetical protein